MRTWKVQFVGGRGSVVGAIASVFALGCSLAYATETASCCCTGDANEDACSGSVGVIIPCGQPGSACSYVVAGSDQITFAHSYPNQGFTQKKVGVLGKCKYQTGICGSLPNPSCKTDGTPVTTINVQGSSADTSTACQYPCP